MDFVAVYAGPDLTYADMLSILWWTNIVSIGIAVGVDILASFSEWWLIPVASLELISQAGNVWYHFMSGTQQTKYTTIYKWFGIYGPGIFNVACYVGMGALWMFGGNGELWPGGPYGVILVGYMIMVFPWILQPLSFMAYEQW